MVFLEFEPMFSDYGGHAFPFIFLLYKINEDEKLGLIKS